MYTDSEDLLKKCFELYFCITRAYKGVGQIEDIKVLILGTMSMLSQYYNDRAYIDLTTQYFVNTDACYTDLFKKQCPKSDQLFDWMVRYYNFVRVNMGYKLETKEKLDTEMCADKMTKKWWGSRTWYLIHKFAAMAPEECTYLYFICYKSFIVSLGNLIPCEECKAHLKENLKGLPIDCYAGSRVELFGWSFKLHNIVNNHLNYKQYSWQKAIKEYDV